MAFSEAVERALRTTFAAHEGQTRKGDARVPYATHPVHVALLLARHGADDVALQAALLHDVVEDCPGWSVERVAREFGREVAAVVAELSEDKGLGWEERKRAQVDEVARLSQRALAVKAADKLHNLATLAADLRRASDPELVWRSFRGGRDRTLAMSGDLVRALAARLEPGLARELSAAYDELAAAARRPAGQGTTSGRDGDEFGDRARPAS